MFSKSSVYALSLGLIGSVSFGMTGVNAQIQVTGGSMTGQAAFFVPSEITETNGISLYGANIQTLNLQTDRGNTSQAVFNAINSQFTDVNANGLPDRNDTGILQGTLSGLALSGNGSPVLFRDRPTELEFTLNSFDTLLNLPGTLASPENFNSKLFLPDPIQFEGDQGALQLGNFGANLDDGLIGLPSTYRFSDGTRISNNSEAETSALRVKFQFKGNDVTPEEGTQLDPNISMVATVQVYDVGNSDVTGVDPNTNLAQGQLFALVQNGEVIGYYSGVNASIDPNETTNLKVVNDQGGVIFTGSKDDLTTALNTEIGDEATFDESLLETPPDGIVEIPQGANGIVFIGQANEKFQVQTIGTQATSETKIGPTTGAVAIAIGDIYQYNQAGEFDYTQPLDYRIEGEALSVFTLLDPSLVVSMGGARRDTQFNFEQASTNASLQGRSDGFVAFAGFPGQTNFQEGLEKLDGQEIIDSLDPENCTVCALGDFDPEFSTLINEAVSEDGSVVIIDRDDDDDDDDDRDRDRENRDRGRGNTNIEVIGGENSEVGRTIYLLSLTSSDQPRIVVILLRGDRYFVAVPGHRGHGHGRGLALGRRERDQVVVFKQVGPSSRIFPGQVSIIEINPESLPDGFAEALQSVLTEQGLVASNITINNTTINNNVNVEDSDNTEINIDNDVDSNINDDDDDDDDD